MVNRNLIRHLDDEDITNELAVLAPEEEADEWLLEWLGRGAAGLRPRRDR